MKQANLSFLIIKSILLQETPGDGKSIEMSEGECPQLGDPSCTAASTHLAQNRCSVNMWPLLD